MSLLMDALRKAERAKRQSGENNDATPSAGGLSELGLEPLTATITPASPLPVLAQHLESLNAALNAALNADLAATSAASVSGSAITPPSVAPPAASSRPTALSSRHEEQERNTTRNILAVKQAQQARALRWLFLALVATALLGIGGYFWWQMQSVAKGSFVRPVQPALPAPSNAMAEAASPSVSTATPINPVAILTQLPTTIADLVQASAAQASTPPERTARSTDPQLPPASPIRLNLSTRQPQANPTLERAYRALQADQLSDARRDYEQVLRGDARNVDALLGLATLAARQGQTGDATDFYWRALEADPKELNAQAGLINLTGQADPILSASQLKMLLASHPDSSPLNFALGNLQASQNRWGDAQQAYFRAYTAEPNNADYVYNLAVSLDHLHQNKLAAQYYQNALNAAGTHNSAFDKDQVKRRLLELQP